MSEKVYSIIVTYNPDHSNFEQILIAHINTQCDGIIVVDNNSVDKAELQKTIDGLDSRLINTVFLPDNMGIGYAQNCGIKIAKNLTADFVVLFDQDSLVPANLISCLLAEEALLTSQGNKVGAVGPQYVDPRTGNFYPQIKISGLKIIKLLPDPSREAGLEVSFIIASGSLIKIATLDDVGLMNEPLFIDWVDVEWCLRAADKGYLFFVTNKIAMEHSIGDKRIRSRGREISIHSPVRKYYRLRNNLLLCRLRWVPVGFRARLFINTFFSTILYLYDIKFDRTQIRYVLKGIYDGIRNKSGVLKS